jgi:hypothetical protein
MFAAKAAELTELKAFRRRLLILRRHVIAMLAIRALKRDIISRHSLSFNTQKRLSRQTGT